MYPVLKVDELSGEQFLFIVPETDLEEKFILWFCHQHDMPRQRVNRRESIRFPGWNSPEDTQKNLYAAYHRFRERYKYKEIPDLLGKTREEALRELRFHGLTWSEEPDTESRIYPAGTVAFQQPSGGSSIISESVVRLVFSRGAGPDSWSHQARNEEDG